MKAREAYSMVKKTFSEWSEDRAPMLGAALAYYALFSVAPLLLLGVAVAGQVYGEDAARGRIVEQLQGLMGETPAKAIEMMLANAHQGGGGFVAGVVSVVMLFFGAAGVFVQLQTALNTVWDVETRTGRGLIGLVKDRLLAFGMVLAIGFLLLITLAASAVLAGLSNYLDAWSFGVTGRLLNEVLTFAVGTVLFALIFKFLPEVRIAWRDVWIGAVITSLLFTLGKTLLGWYLGRSTVASAYGAAGSIVVLMIWVYYSAQIVLFGAEFTQVYANRYGSRILPPQVVPSRETEPVHA